jgi:pimeloyl-ACP methyl ester carboxylesterase
VVHGDHDPLFPLPHGEALRDAIPGAELLVLGGARHDLPRPVWDVFVPAQVRHTGADVRLSHLDASACGARQPRDARPPP